MKQAFKESLAKCGGPYEQIKSLGYVYASKRERSLKETVYQVKPELWLRKIFRGVLYPNSSIPEKVAE